MLIYGRNNYLDVPTTVLIQSNKPDYTIVGTIFALSLGPNIKLTAVDVDGRDKHGKDVIRLHVRTFDKVELTDNRFLNID